MATVPVGEGWGRARVAAFQRREIFRADLGFHLHRQFDPSHGEDGDEVPGPWAFRLSRII